MPKKILFINQEITPYLPDSTMSVLGQQLPEKIQEKGFEIRTFMPKWGTINERRGQLHEVIRLSGLNISVDDNDHPLLIKVASIPVSRVQVYFIDNEDYFNKRQMIVDKNGEEYSDNGERAIFFARGVLETVKKLRWVPDVIVCQGWMGAVVPFYVKTVFAEEPCFAETKVVTSLFSEHPEKPFAHFKRSVAYQEATEEMLAEYGDDFTYRDLLKMAIDYSDAVVVAAEGIDTELVEYAKEHEKPVLDYPGNNFTNAYSDFFKEITK